MAAELEDLPVREAFTHTDDEGREREVVVYKGKARHFVRAQRMAGGQSERISICLVQQLVTVDGALLKPKDWEEEDLGLFMDVQGKLLPSGSTTPLDVPSA